MGFYEFLRSVFVSVVRPSFFNSVLACRSATFRKAASSITEFTRGSPVLVFDPREHFRKFCFLFLYPSFCQIISSFLWFVFCCRRIFWHILTPLLCARDLQSFFDLTPSVLFGRPEIEIPGVGFVEWKNILFAFDQISFCVERVALRLRLVLPVVVFIT